MLFGIRRSVRYHMHRRRFYEIWNTVTIVLGVAGGSTAFTGFVATFPPEFALFPPIAALIVTVFSAVDLAVGTARMADRHADFARQFIHLEKEFSHDKSLTDKEHERIVGERLDIEAGEPAPLRLLDVMCHYEILKSLGDARTPPRIPFWRRIFVHFVSQSDFVRRLDYLDRSPY